MRIYNNIPALKTSISLGKVNKAKTSNLEKLSESRINMLLQDELNALNGGALPSYSCQVRISEITGLVKEVKFTRK